MKKLSQLSLVQLYVFLLIVGDHYLPYSIAFGLTAFCSVTLILIKKRFPLFKPLLFLLPLFLILLLGIVGFSNNEYYLFFKEIWYTSKIILYLYFGYLCFSIQKNLPKIIYAVTLAIVALCSIHLFEILINPHVWGTDLLAFRSVGIGIDGSPYVPLLLIYLDQNGSFKGRSGKRLKKVFLWICLISILFSFSRTQMVILAISGLIILFQKRLYLIRYGFSSMFLLVFLLTSGIIKFDITVNNVETDTTILSKFANSLSEMTFREYETRGENLNNYRGYEAFRGLNMILESNTKKQVMGHGFGSYLDLSDVFFDLEKNPKVVSFHNAYIQIALKCGIIGLFFYFIFDLKILFRKVKAYSIRKKNLALESILVLSACDILLSTLIVMGLYAPKGMRVSVILIGSIFSYLNYIKAQRKIGLETT